MDSTIAPRARLVAALALLLPLTACGDDDGTGVPVAASVEVTPEDLLLADVGATRQLTAEVRNADGGIIPGAEVSWSTAAASVATVSPSGLVTAVAPGTTTVTATSGTASGTASVRVAVAAFECQPGGGAPLELRVGEYAVIQDPSDFCLHFASGSREYLLGIQSTSESESRLTPVAVSASVVGAAASTAPAPLPSPAAGSSGGRGVEEGRLARLLRAHRRAEAEALRRDRTLLPLVRDSRRRAALAPGREAAHAVVDSSLSVGERVVFRVRKSGARCGAEDFTEVTGELVFKGETALWFSDVDNPTGGFTQVDWSLIGQRFDNTIEPVSTSYFGAPTDVDENDRIVVLFTKELNAEGDLDEGTIRLGFVSACDFAHRDEIPTSNEGEFFYHIAPDPDGAFGDTLSTQEVRDLALFVIAHEFTHIIQFGVRLEKPPEVPFMEIYTMEGQATLAEEVVGHAFTGHAPKQNLGIDVAFGEHRGIEWYSNAFSDLAFYFGFDGRDRPRVVAAPEECTWVGNPDDPCGSRASWYGVTWSFLRWATDHFAHRFGGDERQLHRALVDNTVSGFDNFTDVLGEDFRELLAPWAASLYLDDRIAGLDPLLTQPSWNFHGEDDGIFPGLVEPANPRPEIFEFGDLSEEFRVRGASWQWYLVGGVNQPTAAVRVTDQELGLLPGFMQLFVVRTQ